MNPLPVYIEWEVENYLEKHYCFLNGFRDIDTPASLGAYGTVISYKNLQEAFKDNPYSKEVWLKCIKYWKSNAYLSPIFMLLSIYVERLVKEKFG